LAQQLQLGHRHRLLKTSVVASPSDHQPPRPASHQRLDAAVGARRCRQFVIRDRHVPAVWIAGHTGPRNQPGRGSHHHLLARPVNAAQRRAHLPPHRPRRPLAPIALFAGGNPDHGDLPLAGRHSRRGRPNVHKQARLRKRLTSIIRRGHIHTVRVGWRACHAQKRKQQAPPTIEGHLGLITRLDALRQRRRGISLKPTLACVTRQLQPTCRPRGVPPRSRPQKPRHRRVTSHHRRRRREPTPQVHGRHRRLVPLAGRGTRR
jgi:hypothetical protein